MKTLIVFAFIGVCSAIPMPLLFGDNEFQSLGERGDFSAPSVKIHSGYANIRRQGRNYGSGFRTMRQYVRGKSSRELQSPSTNNHIEAVSKPERAPVFMGFSNKEKEAETRELKAKIEAASKLALEKMENDILNAIRSSQKPSTTTTTVPSTTTTEKPTTSRPIETTTILEETTEMESRKTTTASPTTEASTETTEKIQPTTEVISEESTTNQISEDETTMRSTTLKQPSEEIDLGSVQEVIS